VTKSFSTQIIKWQKQHGRHGLPWQNTRDAYRVWLSEIMLQQTQVGTVIPYYERFLNTFPTIAKLAAAPDDQVMQHWAGLGYYARARNLHRAAKQIVELHDGIFPMDFDDIHALPGIGRSTAAAISAFAFGERRAILDGNVKRVFARHFGVEGDVKSKVIEDALWTKAESILPKNNIEAYTQGLMDLGATLCTRTKPTCLLCPVARTCVALESGRIDALPGKGVKRDVPHKETRMLVIIDRGEVLLEKRPPTGIWGGLWSLPEVSMSDNAIEKTQSRFGFKSRIIREMEIVPHGFTHYSLSIYPLEIAITKRPTIAMELGIMWVNIEDAPNAAVPAPVKRILKLLALKT
jgi:A/G-specific adenine glycosylase